MRGILGVVEDILGMMGEMTLTIVGEVVMMERVRREGRVLYLGVIVIQGGAVVIQGEAVVIQGEGEADMDAGDIVTIAIDLDFLCYGVMKR